MKILTKLKNKFLNVLHGEDPKVVSITDKRYTINKKAYQYALDMTRKEIYQAVEGMYHRQNCGLV